MSAAFCCLSEVAALFSAHSCPWLPMSPLNSLLSINDALKQTRGIKLQNHSCVSSGAVTAQLGLLNYRHTHVQPFFYTIIFACLRCGSRHSRDSSGRDTEGQDDFKHPMSQCSNLQQSSGNFPYENNPNLGAPGSHTHWSDKPALNCSLA